LGFQFPSKSGRSDFKVQATEGARMSTVYRARTIKRDRRTKAQIEQLDEQILDVLATDHPQSVRHVFYRMTDPRLAEPVEKSDRGYRMYSIVASSFVVMAVSRMAGSLTRRGAGTSWTHSRARPTSCGAWLVTI